MGLYFPIMVVLLLIFVTSNLILLPFAYFVAIINKILLIKNYNHLSRNPSMMIADLVTFIVTGVFSLFLIQFKDAFNFLRHLFYVRQKQKFNSDLKYLNIDSFEILQQIFDEYGGVKAKNHVKVREIAQKVSERLNISKSISKLLYGNAYTKARSKTKVDEEK